MKDAVLEGRPATTILAVFLCALAAGCDDIRDYLSDRFKTCEDVRVEIINSEQTREGYYLLGPGERATHERWLESGSSRTLGMCIEIGHGYKFRAEKDERVIAVGQCPASRHSYEGLTVSVVWTPVGFQCVNW